MIAEAMHRALLSADILELLPKEGSFDNVATHLMSDAYYEACRLLEDGGQPMVVRRLIAKRVIDLTVAGESRPSEIAAKALSTLGIKPRIIP
jgi:hypothetical protein